MLELQAIRKRRKLREGAEVSVHKLTCLMRVPLQSSVNASTDLERR